MIPMRFAVATHILLLLVGQDRPAAPAGAAATGHATSVWLAAQVKTNPVVVRRISGRLARAGLVRVRRGAGGAELARDPAAITLEDVWRALNEDESRPLMSVHPTAGAQLRAVLMAAFGDAEAGLRAALRRITLEHLARRLAAGSG